MITRFIILVFVSLAVSGCSKVKHLPQLLALKDMAEEQASIDSYVEYQRAKFQKMITLYEENRLANYSNKDSVVAEFGEPRVIRLYTYNDKEFEEWLYRDPVTYFDTDVIYLYFDDKGALQESKYEPHIANNK